MGEDMLEAFLAESEELLERIDETVGDIERGEEGAVDALFRHVHTIKGSAGIVGYQRLEDFAHALETRMGRIRQGQARFGPASYRALGDCRSHIASVLEDFRISLAGEGGAEQSASTQEADLMVLVALDATIVPVDESQAEGGASSAANGKKRLKDLREKAKKAASPEKAATDAMARIPASKLERILSYSSEIVVALSNFAQSARASGAGNLAYELAAVESLAASLYRSVLEIRMVPFGEIAGRFVKAVEEIAKDRGKKIRFVLSGAETEIDKSLADRMVEPLLHLIRNAADHGIEAPERRKELGKAAEGVVALRARRESGLLSVRIEDDGQGIDPAEIRAAALRRGRLGEEERTDEESLFDLLFEAGFSLSDKVTRWSGRGVGLDVVKKSIVAMRGTVRFESRKGLGSSVVVRLPLALSLVEGFVARIGEMKLLIPFEATTACVEIEDELEGGSWRTTNWQGKLIPAIDLGRLFGEAPKERRRVSVILDNGGTCNALIVDEVGETVSAAVRPLDRRLADSPGVAGSAVLGDGSMVLVLDTGELSLMAQRRHGAGEGNSP